MKCMFMHKRIAVAEMSIDPIYDRLSYHKLNNKI